MEAVKEFTDEWYVNLYEDDIKELKKEKKELLKQLKAIEMDIQLKLKYIREIKGVNENVE